MKFRKLAAIALTLVLSVSFSTSASAAEYPDCEMIGMIESSNELDTRIAKEIEASNLRVEQLWQKAVAESNSGVYRMGDAPLDSAISPLVNLYSASASITEFFGLRVAGIRFKATDLFGNDVIESVRTISATGTNQNSSVTVDDYSYTLIDGSRTIAVKYSCTVGARNSDEESFVYFSKDYYVEFHVSGEAVVY